MLKMVDKTRFARIHFALCVNAAVCGTVLGGCSLFLPHPSVRPDARMMECPLDVSQSRKDLPQSIRASGIPTPLVIRARRAPGADRTIQAGQSVYFVATHRDAAPAQDVEPGMSRRIVPMDLPGAIPPAAVWQLEMIAGAGGDPRPLLSDRNLVRLHSSSQAGYLELNGDGRATMAPVTRATQFVMHKADVADSTRPTSCDAQIRDGDFIFLQGLEPSAWMSVDDDGALYVAQDQTGVADTPPSGVRNPRCVQEEERCHTDQAGGLVCAWAPVCAR